MPSTSGFLKLDTRFRITARLTPEAPIHVGSGTANELTDAPLLRDGHGEALIPGSSLRGVMRSTLERILQALGGDRGCVLFAEDSHPTCFTATGNGKLKEFNEENERLPVAEREEKLNEKILGDGLCDICKLFGSPLLASKLRISDAKPHQPVSIIRDGVGIDRDTESAQPGIKYDFETLEADSLGFTIEIENATDEDLALLAILFQEMERSGIDVGGKKSRGLGRVKLSLEDPIEAFETPEQLTAYITSGTMPPVSLEAFKQRLAGCVSSYLNRNQE